MKFIWPESLNIQPRYQRFGSQVRGLHIQGRRPEEVTFSRSDLMQMLDHWELSRRYIHHLINALHAEE